MGVITIPQRTAKSSVVSTQRKQAAAIRTHLEKAFALPSLALAIRRSRARKQRNSMLRTSRSASPSSESKPFRFMDLPSELRLQIYGLAMAKEGRLYLDKLKAPALAAVSRQVRNESLPVFLEVNQFTTLLCRQPDSTFGIWFADSTLNWLRDISVTTPLIRDITFALQPSNWEADDFLVEDFRVTVTKQGAKLSHGRDCPFCQNGTYGDHVKPLPLTHPAMSPKFREMLSAAQQQHDRNLQSATPLLLEGNNALTLMDVVDLAVPFHGPSELFTAEQTDYKNLVDYLAEEIEEWESEGEGERKEIEDKLEVVANEIWSL